MFKSGVIFSLALMVAANCSQLQAQECDEECFEKFILPDEPNYAVLPIDSETTFYLIENIDNLKTDNTGLTAGMALNRTTFSVGTRQRARLCLREIVSNATPVDGTSNTPSKLSVAFHGTFEDGDVMSDTLSIAPTGRQSCRYLPAQYGDYDVIIENPANLPAVVATLTIAYINED